MTTVAAVLQWPQATIIPYYLLDAFLLLRPAARLVDRGTSSKDPQWKVLMMMTLPRVLYWRRGAWPTNLFDYIGSLLFDARLHALNTATGIALLTLLEKDRRRVVHVATLCHKRSVGELQLSYLISIII